jgi:uncharacterized protein YkvS
MIGGEINENSGWRKKTTIENFNETSRLREKTKINER